jgi:hypothetical protein
MRLSAAFVFARVEMGLQGLRNRVEDVPVKDKPKRRERTRRLRGDEEERLLAACRESRSPRSSSWPGKRPALRRPSRTS